MSHLEKLLKDYCELTEKAFLKQLEGLSKNEVDVILAMRKAKTLAWLNGECYLGVNKTDRLVVSVDYKQFQNKQFDLVCRFYHTNHEIGLEKVGDK